LSCTVQTECAHCQRPIHIQIDSELSYQVLEEGAEPLIQVPMVNVHELEAPSIIDGF
jgi:uncharacterized metal-binding protein YceD (DUF177 family)